MEDNNAHRRRPLLSSRSSNAMRVASDKRKRDDEADAANKRQNISLENMNPQSAANNGRKLPTYQEIFNKLKTFAGAIMDGDDPIKDWAEHFMRKGEKAEEALDKFTANPDARERLKLPPPELKLKNKKPAPALPSNLTTAPLDPIKATLKGKYELAEVSIISSHKVEKRVTRILDHLARFSWTDKSVLPGIAFAFAREKDINKLVSVMELAKRQIHDDEQKWYQYNGLYHVEKSAVPEVIEETVVDGMDVDEEEGETDDFEVMRDRETFAIPERFANAILPERKPEKENFMAIFLARVPVPELNNNSNFTMQTNAEAIDRIRAKRNGQI